MYSSSSSLSTSSSSDSSSSSISKSSLSSSSVSNSYSSSSSSSVSLSSKSSVTHSSLSSSSKSSSTSSSSSTEIMSSFSSSSSSSTEIKSSSSSSSSSTEIKSSSSTEIKSSSSSTEFMTSSDSSSSSSGIDIENEVIVSMACRDYGEGRIFIHTDRIGAYLTGHGNNNLNFWRKILEWTSKKNPNENIRIGLINNTQQDSFNQIKNISFIGIDNIKMSDMSFVNLSDYDCIYFVGLSLSISSTITLKIKEFVENGGGLIIEYPNISRQNINVLRDIENIMCHSADRLLFTNSYWTIDGGNHYIYYDPVEISFMSTLRHNDFSEEWTILMSNIPNVVTTTTTTGNGNILDFNLSSGSEFVVSFISSMQNGIVEIEEDVSSSSSSESSYIGTSLSSDSSNISTDSSSTSSDYFDLVFTKYDNTIPAASNTVSTNGRLARGITGGDSTGVIHPCVIKDGNTYKMWYGSASETTIYYATSSDGLNWTKYDNTVETRSNQVGHNGKIPLGTSGGDSEGISYPCVIKDGSVYKMWYSGRCTLSSVSRWRIYYAYSYDGLTWIKYDNSVPSNSNTVGTNGRIPIGLSASGIGDCWHVRNSCVIKDGLIYKMWYSGYNCVGANRWKIYYAYSYDGLTWIKYDNLDIAASNTTGTNGRIPLGTSGKGDYVAAFSPVVIKNDGVYKMWYSGDSGSDAYRTYYATSLDGLTWIKYDNTIPSNSDASSTGGRIPLGTSTSLIGDRSRSGECSVIIDNGIYKAWYSGYYTSLDIYYAEG